MGTAMGCRCAVCLANLFMGWLESCIMEKIPDYMLPWLWKRFIDDIIMIWSHGRSSLEKLLEFINNIHPTIKFEVTISDTSVNFLDTVLYFDEDMRLRTDLYIQPTVVYCYIINHIIQSPVKSVSFTVKL